MPDPGNPQSLNRYAYALNSPLRYTDPTGHAWRDMSDGAGPNGTGSWAGALASAARTNQEYSTVRALLVTVASVAAEPIDWGVTLHQCVTEGCNPALAALGLLPFIPGSVATHLDDISEAVRITDRLGGVGKGYERFRSIGAEVLPDVLQAFGDAGRKMVTDIPAEFAGRRVTTLGQLSDTATAGGLGERILNIPNWSLSRNFEWLVSSAQNGDIFYLAPQVNEKTLLSREFGISVHARELDTLLKMGYRRVGDYLVPGW